MNLEILGAESMGARSLCCLVTLPDRRILLDPGVALGYVRSKLLPHPLQVAVGRRIREKIVRASSCATDVVFSHFHGDHVPLVDANPYQLSLGALPEAFRELRCWSKSGDDLTGDVRQRFRDLADLFGTNLEIAEGRTEGRLSFSRSVPHGAPESNLGTLMMTRIEMDHRVFVHASDIQLLHEPTLDQVLDWAPDIVLAGGPPLYMNRLSNGDLERAWKNSVRLAREVEVVILDHHLMRSEEGAVWLDRLSETVGRKVYCAADYMGRPRLLLEARRPELYERMPVPEGWHERYAQGQLDADEYLEESEINI